jgi:serine/threonine protein kinase
MVETRISHYVLTRPIGAGAFGEVWEGVHAQDPAFRVAIKVLSPSLRRDPVVVEALKAECRTLDRLDHPNIVRFRELVVDPSWVAMVLELLQGEDLEAALGSGPQAPLEVVRLLEAVLQGLAFAHAQGVMHQDIKPSNVFRCHDGRVKIMDFGISQAVDRGEVPGTAGIRGTLCYLAPERFEGLSRPAGDVYAMGLVAWELLSGRRACPDLDIAAVRHWHREIGVVDIRELRPEVPHWLAALVAACTARDADTRPVDGAAALALLRELREPAWEVRSHPVGVANLRPVPTGPHTVEVPAFSRMVAESGVPTPAGRPLTQPPRGTPQPVAPVAPEPAPRTPSTGRSAPSRSARDVPGHGTSDPYRTPSRQTAPPRVIPKSKGVFLALALFGPSLGLCGLQQFYIGQWVRGLLMLLTFGACGIWQIIDLCMCAFGGIKDSKGVPLEW